MGTAAQTVKQKQRQPVFSRLPFSSIKGVLTGKSKPKRRASAKVKKSSKGTRRQRQFRVLLTHSTQIVITIKPVRKSNRKAKPLRRLAFWPYLPLNRQVAYSTALIVAGILGTVYFSWHVVFASPASPPPISRGSVPAVGKIGNDVKRTHYPKSQPTHLTISAIDVDTSVSTVGKNADGSIIVPTDYHTAGWYRYSPTPGEIGPSVIVGHLDNVNGLAVFWRLHELQPGDMIQVGRADGSTLQFKVDSVKQFSQSDFPTQEVYGNIKYAGLRLITCGGTFNRLTHHYDQNTVVYASLAN